MREHARCSFRHDEDQIERDADGESAVMRRAVMIVPVIMRRAVRMGVAVRVFVRHAGSFSRDGYALVNARRRPVVQTTIGRKR